MRGSGGIKAIIIIIGGGIGGLTTAGGRSITSNPRLRSSGSRSLPRRAASWQPSFFDAG
jgi:hypothetical protein